MERAFRLDTTDARILMELDQLYKRVRRPHKERLAFLRQYPDLIEQRDDLVLEEITLLNQTGEYEKAKALLDAHSFHPWEGGEGKVPAQYQLARVELAKQALTAGNNQEAIALLEECLEYPHHLGEGKLYGAQENDFYYFLGCAYENLNRKDEAVRYWEQATVGPTEPAAAMYYNDAKPDKIFYQGLALLKLGRIDEANGRFHKFIINPDANAENKESFLKEGSPSAFKVKAGSGPRHLTFSPNGNYAYLINELSGTVIAFEYKDGDLKEIQTIVADTVCAKGSGDIHISPDGKFLYASNRLKADGIAIFSIQPDNGILTKVGYQLTGIHPRNFIITPNGKYMLVACRDSNVIQIYERDADTGLLTDIHGDIKVDKPVCVKFIPNPKQS
jgi:tetratricopeptide (TPR) repeat protein